MPDEPEPPRIVRLDLMLEDVKRRAWERLQEEQRKKKLAAAQEVGDE